jgi:hypothetical protein
VANPYKWNEIEIRQFRGQKEKPVADWVKKAGYPLIKEGGPNGEKNPYVEVDLNGHKVHKYRRYIYEPRFFKKAKGLPKKDDGTYETPAVTEPLVFKKGPHKGKRLDKLVIVYEKIPGYTEWICYDAYWVWSTEVSRLSSLPGMRVPPGARYIGIGGGIKGLDPSVSPRVP